MIGEKGEHTLKRLVGLLITWKAFFENGEDDGSFDPLINHQFKKLDNDWQVEECLDGRR
jgi:hypothetical protein